MKKIITLLGVAIPVSFIVGFYVNGLFAQANEARLTLTPTPKKVKKQLKLGAFSVSLSVKDLKASKEFYEKMGFESFAGSMEQKYLILKNGNALIGLFEGMFQGNMLTFNPGWDENAKNVDPLDDIRQIQQHLKSQSIPLTSEADEKTTGPASLMAVDPDGNVILIDQHR